MDRGIYRDASGRGVPITVVELVPAAAVHALRRYESSIASLGLPICTEQGKLLMSVMYA